MPRSGERLAIAETGAISTNVTIQIDSGLLRQCVTFLQSDARHAGAWLQYLASLTESRDFELLTWWSVSSNVLLCLEAAKTCGVAF